MIKSSHNKSETRNGSTNILLVILLVTAFLSLYSGIQYGHDWGDDFSGYIMQAESLVHGNPSAFVAANRFTIERSSRRIAPIAYPWGFPVLLAPIYELFGLNMTAFKTLNIICYLFFLVLLWFAWPQNYSNFRRFLFVSLFACNPYFQQSMNEVLSDVPFLLFSTLTVILICRVVVEKRCLLSPIADRLLLGLTMAGAFLIRTNGFLLVVTLGVSQVISAVENVSERLAYFKRASIRGLQVHRSDLWLIALPYVSFGTAVVLHQVVLPQGQLSYFSELSGFSPAEILGNLNYYIDLPAEFFRGVPHRYLIYGATIPLAITGMFQRRASDYPMVLYSGLTVLLYIFWPYREGLRFLFPVIPFYIYFVFIGLERYWQLHPYRFSGLGKIISLGPVFLVLFYFVKISAANGITNHNAQRAALVGPYRPTAQQLFSYITRNTEPNAVIVFRKPRAMRLFTGHPSIMVEELDKIERGDYLCMDVRENRDAQLALVDVSLLFQRGQISPVYQNRDFGLYRVNKS